MSAQQTNQQSTSQTTSKEDQRSQKHQLARRGPFGLPSLWTDPADAFVGPFSLMRRMQEEMNRVFQSGLAGISGVGEELRSTHWPALEITSKENALEISAELPGLTNDDVKVEVDNDVVVIRGERKSEHETTEGGVHRSERRYGQFYRAVPLPEGAETEGAHAEFENGMLRITVPVSQPKSNARQIPIHATGTSKTEKSTTKGDKAA